MKRKISAPGESETFDPVSLSRRLRRMCDTSESLLVTPVSERTRAFVTPIESVIVTAVSVTDRATWMFERIESVKLDPVSVNAR